MTCPRAIRLSLIHISYRADHHAGQAAEQQQLTGAFVGIRAVLCPQILAYHLSLIHISQQTELTAAREALRSREKQLSAQLLPNRKTAAQYRAAAEARQTLESLSLIHILRRP